MQTSDQSVGPHRFAARAAILAVGAMVALGVGASALAGGGSLPLPTSAPDYHMPGTQPFGLMEPIAGADECFACHQGFDTPAATNKPYRWRGSAHAHAARDPIFRAAVQIANHQAPGSGETCFRCHAPRAWVEGRGAADGSQLTIADVDEGVGCNVCHRMVDPIFTSENPNDDLSILAALMMDPNAGIPVTQGNAQYILDPIDFRRGPFDDVDPPHLWLHSPHHQTADLCATCHDVSNPVFDRVGGMVPQPGDTYVLNMTGSPHPTQDKHDQFPEQRTYSEWLASAFAQPGGVPLYNPADPYDLNGRFGGNLADQMMHPAGAVGKCQDCHMPDRTGQGCIEIFDPPVRDDLPDHGFVGANVTLLDMIQHLYGDDFDEDFLFTNEFIDRARAETIQMVASATDLEVTQDGCGINVRVINQCGHKLMTGYPEGRRIWINVKFRDGSSNVIAERGAYDFMTAELTENDTKVYQVKLGLDSYMASQTGLPAGESFNLILNNTILLDNRIPPRGFTNAAFESIQAQPVGYSYADGQHWDDTEYLIPPGAASAEVTVYYQTTSKEYIEFLRDNAPPGTMEGQIVYDAWEATGKSAPLVMGNVVVPVSASLDGDADGNGVVDIDDITFVVLRLGQGAGPGDVDGSGSVNIDDITYVVLRLGQSCS